MLKIEALARSHDRRLFDCGQESLNRFLQQSARQHIERDISRTFVLIDDNEPNIIRGYFTLTACEVVAADIVDPRLQKYPHPLPVAKLARLAVTKTWQRQGLGGLMLVEAMRRTLAIAEHVGLIGLVVDAKDEMAASFYREFGFVALGEGSNCLFLPLDTLRQALV